MVTRVQGRVARFALRATPAMRLRLMGELALLEIALDPVEAFITKNTVGLAEESKRLPKARKRALPAFRRGRGLLPKARRAS